VPLPTLVTITGQLLDASEQPMVGVKVTFTPTSNQTDALGTPVAGSVTDAAGSLLIPMAGVLAVTNAAGQLLDADGEPVALVPTDTAGLEPAGWQYQVTISVPGVPDYGFSCFLLANPFAFTATNAAPAVFTAAGSAYANGAAVALSGASLPAGFTAGTTYYVTGAAGTAFSLALTPGGVAVASTSAGSGTVATAVTDLSALGS
jgi:hypothetical protein